ncbi:hypothetical protein QQS21_005769, partial [Conoideocrella luteorostrata]
MSGSTKQTPSVVTSFAPNPLTTTFTRPDDCSGIYRSGFLMMVDVSKTCMPSGFKTDAYFSPGYVCPAGYVSACHDNTGVASLTTVTCCPTVNDPSIRLGCVTTSTLSSIWSTLFCTWIAPKDSNFYVPLTTVANGVTTTQSVGLQAPGGLNAFGVRMVYQSSDMVTATTTTAKTTASTTDTSSGGSSTSNPSQSAGEPGGLSTGAKVAIGVVIPVVALAAIIGVFLWWRRRKHHYQPQSQTEPKPVHQAPNELHGTHVNELA